MSMFEGWGGWGFGGMPERPTEYLRFVAAGPAFATAWKEIEKTVMPPSWEVFMYGYMQHKKINSKASVLNYAKMVALWSPGSWDDEVGGA
jgi:hypothetical protein